MQKKILNFLAYSLGFKSLNLLMPLIIFSEVNGSLHNCLLHNSIQDDLAQKMNVFLFCLNVIDFTEGPIMAPEGSLEKEVIELLRKKRKLVRLLSARV